MVYVWLFGAVTRRRSRLPQLRRQLQSVLYSKIFLCPIDVARWDVALWPALALVRDWLLEFLKDTAARPIQVIELDLTRKGMVRRCRA